MVKICYITTIPGTLEAFVLKTAQYIHEHTDWDITFICDEDEQFQKRLPEYIHYYPVRMERGINISGIMAMLKMRNIFSEQNFDLIQYSTPNASLYASIAGRLAKVPIRLYCQWGLVYVGFTGIKRFIFKTIEKLVCGFSTWIEPDSKSNLKFAHSEGLYPEEIGSVIWNGSACGIDLVKFDVNKKNSYRHLVREQYDIPLDAYVFGFVGRITRDKGINELFSAARQLLDENTYLLIVGSEEVDETVDKDLYEWSKSSSFVKYTGFTRIVEQYLAAMDCFVLPSYREGFGMTVIEAEAMAVPVIITNIPGPIDGMKNNETGFVVKMKDVDGLRRAMFEMREIGGAAMGQKGLDFVKNSFEQYRLFELVLADRKRLLKEKNRILNS